MAVGLGQRSLDLALLGWHDLSVARGLGQLPAALVGLGG